MGLKKFNMPASFEPRSTPEDVEPGIYRASVKTVQQERNDGLGVYVNFELFTEDGESYRQYGKLFKIDESHHAGKANPQSLAKRELKDFLTLAYACHAKAGDFDPSSLVDAWLIVVFDRIEYTDKATRDWKEMVAIRSEGYFFDDVDMGLIDPPIHDPRRGRGRGGRGGMR